MTIQKIVDDSQNYLGVFIPGKDWDEIKKLLPKNEAAKAEIKFSGLLNDFSWFQLTELSTSTLSDLRAYYIGKETEEEEKANPNADKIQQFQSLGDSYNSILGDHQNFESREKMVEIITKHARILKSLQ